MKTLVSKSKDKPQSSQRRSKSLLEKDQHKKDNIQPVAAKASPLQLYEIPQLQTLRQNFKKEIENPIHAQITMHFAKTAQRCLIHNNVITLYCLNERKPLCVTCMYQNNQHKKHKVIPLNRANQELQEQISTYINVVSRQIDKTSKLLNQSHVYLKRVQREFPDLISRVEGFYMSLHEILVQKKNEQIQHIQQTWTRLRVEYGSISKELENINVYFMQKVAEVKTRGGEQNLLLNRNIASHLAHLSHIIPENLCQYHENTYQNELKKFQDIRTLINNKLVFTSPYQQKISRNNSRKQSQSQSPAKNALTPSPKPKRNNRSNSNLKSSTKLQTTKNEQEKSPTFGQKSPSKLSSFKRSGSSLKRP